MATTATLVSRTDRSELQQLARRLSAWRARRSPGQRIPDVLWRGAADLARVHGVSAVSAALQLNYYDLQRRFRTGSSGGSGPLRPPTFVEVAPAAAALSGGERGTLELVHPCGSRLILRLPQGSVRDWVPLVERFLRPRP